MREYYYFPCIDLPVNPKGWFALFFGGDTKPGYNKAYFPHALKRAVLRGFPDVGMANGVRKMLVYPQGPDPRIPEVSEMGKIREGALFFSPPHRKMGISLSGR